jgi:hypothetical protein
LNGAAARRRLFWLLSGVALLLFLAACGNDKEASDTYLAPNGDKREQTASLSELPAFLENGSEKQKLAYQAAALLPDTLRWIPCYCGCGDSAGHKSNFNCFIHELRQDGTVVWDDHGTRCDICMSIALKTAQLKSQGKSDSDIRRFIDAGYDKGFANPTDTPFPAS